MKRLMLIRDQFSEKSSMGTLSLNGGSVCDTLEDKTRPLGVKVPGETCIPEGVYKVSLVMSPKRGYVVPLLQNVPMFTAIEMHIGNTPEDTEGCILLGNRRGTDRLYDSTAAFHTLMVLLDNDPDIEISVSASPEKLAEAGLT